MEAGKAPAKNPPAASIPKKAATPRPVVSPASEHVAFQLINAQGAQTREESEANDAASGAINEASPYGVIIEDGLPPGEGQVNRTPFMDKLAPTIESAADDILKRAGRVAKDCPYLGFWVAYYRQQSAAHIERVIAKYVKPDHIDLASIEAAILGRVREAVTAWVDQRAVQVPEEIDWRVADDRVSDSPGEGAPVQRMGADGHGAPAAPGSAAAVRGQLSSGRPLDSTVRTRMERGFRTSFAAVRIHTDQRAASAARRYDARAFTVGQDVAFGAGEYRPGSLRGDLLLAHELAHTIQQRGAAVEAPGGKALETDATLSAIGAILPETVLGPRPDLRGGLELRRCGTGEEPAPPAVDEKEYKRTIAELRQLYAHKKLIEDGTAPAAERDEVDRKIATLSERVKGWGVQVSARQLRRAVESGEDLRSRIGEPMLLDPEDMADLGYRLERPPGELTVGRSYELKVRGQPRIFADGSSSDIYSGSWYVRKPGETDLHGLAGWTGSSHAWTLDVTGDWQFAVKVRVSGADYGVLTDTITVRQPDAVAEERLGKVPKTELTSYLAGLEYQNLLRTHLGVVDQQFGVGAAYISLVGANPVDNKNANILDIPYNRYTAHPPKGRTPTRYQWVAVPSDLSKYPTQSYYGLSRGIIGGRDGFDLGTGATANWLPEHSGIVSIYCTMFDAAGQVAEAHYRQVILTSDEAQQVSKFQSYMRDARDELKKLREQTAFYVPAFHVATESGVTTELSLFMGVAASGTDIKIIDVTPAVPRREYGGSDFAAALNDFNYGNSYPAGKIRLRIPDNAIGITVQDWTVTTSGASVSQRLSTIAGWESLGLAGLGVLAAISGAEPLAAAFFLAAAGTGAVSAGAGLYQQSLEAHPSGFGIAINIASLAGSLLGMAGAANILRHGPRVAALTKAGQFVLYAGFVSDTVGGVFILAEGAEQIAAILDGSGGADSKAAAITRILAGLLFNGTMLAWGSRDLGKTRERVRGLVGDGKAEKLTTSEMHMLSVLEGPSLSRLSGASLEETQSVAALVREDPARAAALVERYGEQFVVGARSRPESLEALAQALQAGVPEAAGTRGSYGPRTTGGIRPAYLEVVPAAGKRGPSSQNGLAKRVLQVFTKGASTERIALLQGATLRPVPGTAPAGGAQTRFELIVPASGARAEMVVPVRIESTAVRPTSVHGTETGPARMQVRSTTSASGAISYEANIEVHENLAAEDVGFAVGHELDELASIAISGVSGADITAQKRASLFRAQIRAAGASAPIATAHDIAQAAEFANFVSKRVAAASRTKGFHIPDDVLARAVEMGFGNSVFLEEKLNLLRTAGVDADMLERLRTMALRSEASAALPSTSPLATSKLLGHLLHEDGGSKVSPVGGLHLDSALTAHQADLVAKNQPTHLLKTADSPRIMGGVTYNAYEQWVWTGGGTPGPRPATPGSAAGTNLGGWVLAADPKTTFDKLVPFLSEAQAAWDTWRAANPAASGANVPWQSAAGSGRQTIGGFVDLSGPTVELRTVYPLRAGGLTSW